MKSRLLTIVLVMSILFFNPFWSTCSVSGTEDKPAKETAKKTKAKKEEKADPILEKLTRLKKEIKELREKKAAVEEQYLEADETKKAELESELRELITSIYDKKLEQKKLYLEKDLEHLAKLQAKVNKTKEIIQSLEKNRDKNIKNSLKKAMNPKKKKSKK